jgi:DNA invertase Pin-like site-specific DNA recombinase
MATGTNVCGYVRVSTAEQSDSGAGLQAQRAAIRAEARRHGWTLVEIFEDVASGRSLRQRPGLEAAFAAVADGAADGLIVSKLDRLSRSVGDFSSILSRFQRNGWALVVMDLGVDTSTIMGAAMAQMVSVFSELERKRIGERTREALSIRRDQGVRLGRPPTVPQKLVRRIERQRARGESLRAIAESLNADAIPTAHGGAKWHASTVRTILARQPEAARGELDELVHQRTSAPPAPRSALVHKRR